jgi:3-oxoadipate enol-lactonase
MLPERVVVEDGPSADRLPWHAVELSGRGHTYACDLAGPRRRSPTVVLLHGLMATGELNWGPYLRALNQQFRVVALDHRGHGRGVSRPFTLADCADDVVALADALGIKKAILVGYSMGGPIAQLVWHRHPERVRGLVLCATAADFRQTPMRRLAAAMLEELSWPLRMMPRPVLIHTARSHLPGIVGDREVQVAMSDAIANHDDVAIREATRAVRQFSSTDWIDAAALPTAVVLTERDRLVTPAQQLGLAELIPGSEVIPVDADHMAFLNAPARFSPALVHACTLVAHRSRRRRWRLRSRRRAPAMSLR